MSIAQSLGFKSAVEILQEVTNQSINCSVDANRGNDDAAKTSLSNGLEKCPIFVPEYLQETVLTDSYDEDEEEEAATDEMGMEHSHLYGEVPVDAQLNHYQYKYMANEQETSAQLPNEKRQPNHHSTELPVKYEKYQNKSSSYEQYADNNTTLKSNIDQTDHNSIERTFYKGISLIMQFL